MVCQVDTFIVVNSSLCASGNGSQGELRGDNLLNSAKHNAQGKQKALIPYLCREPIMTLSSEI